MKLYYSTTSPFARKVLAVSIVTGLYDRIDRIEASPHPIDRDASVLVHNPLAKVPTLVTPEGLALFDSRVIAEYLDANAVAASVFPKDRGLRWKALALQSLADGILDAALLIRYERTARPEDLRWSLWQERQFDKIVSALDALEGDQRAPDQAVDIGTITLGSALGYLDLRFPDFPWRAGRPNLESWFETFALNDFLVRTAAPLPKAA
ncbi:MAG: glutathione S-transferase N-terminal domain-containing protein [Rhizobiaceae bacterium]|nr:glutathione S-transferase N-terminal domain-containing protein [Rhizobiaceae bacterium]